jgi:hypothetical protein
MTFLNLTCDLLVFTDRSQTVGGTLDAVGPSVGRAVTGGLVRLIDEWFFDETKTQSPSWADLSAWTAEQTDDIDGLERYVSSSHSWDTTSTPLGLGAIATDFDDTDGVIKLGDAGAWRPAGSIRTRRVGEHKLVFVESTMNLAGAMTPDLSVDAVPLVSEGSELTLIKAWGPCGVCGVCGMCALCAEVNVAGALSAATAAMMAVPAMKPEYAEADVELAVQQAVLSRAQAIGKSDRITFATPEAARS